MGTAQNKLIVEKYNKEVIEPGNIELLKEILTEDFINHSALPGMPSGIDGMIYFFAEVLHKAFAEITVEIKEMIAEGDKVTTRKEIKGTHQGPLLGIPATGKKVVIKVIDILTIENGKVKEHWGENNFASVIQTLSAN